MSLFIFFFVFFFIIDIIERMITDNVHFLILRLEQMIENAVTDSKDDELYWNQFIRFWNMIEILIQKHAISRTDLVQDIFSQRYSELDLYEQLNIISYSMISSIQPYRKQIFGPVEKDAPSDDKYYRDLENVFVSAGSPRMRSAFERILTDSRMIQLKNFVEDKLKKKKLKSNQKNLEEELTAISQTRRDLIREHEVLTNSYPLVSFLKKY